VCFALLQVDRESGSRPQPQVGVPGGPGARDQPHLLLEQPCRLCKRLRLSLDPTDYSQTLNRNTSDDTLTLAFVCTSHAASEDMGGSVQVWHQGRAGRAGVSICVTEKAPHCTHDTKADRALLSSFPLADHRSDRRQRRRRAAWLHEEGTPRRHCSTPTPLSHCTAASVTWWCVHA
jgi:hypothetical protein